MKILGILRPTDNGWVWETEPQAESTCREFQQVVDLALRVDKNGNVLPQRVINPTTVKEEEI